MGSYIVYIFCENVRHYDDKLLNILMSEILRNEYKQYGIPYCSTEHVMSMN